MKQLNSVLFVFAALVLFFASSCKKKEKTPELSFSASSVTVNKDGSATVSIQLSNATDNVVEVAFQSVGTTQVYFGTYNGVFIRDDSDKMEANIDAHAFIDTIHSTNTSGHIKITPGSQQVVITFKPKDDDFAHAASNFAIKMVSAVNATIKQGADTYTYNINSSPVHNRFTSTIKYSDVGNNISQFPYSTQSISYTKNGNGNYDLTLNYAPVNNNGAVANLPSTLTISYLDLPQFQATSTTFPETTMADCTTYTVTVTINNSAGPVTLTCTDLTSFSLATFPVLYSRTPSGAYGDYLISNGILNIEGSGYSLKGDLTSTFIHY